MSAKSLFRIFKQRNVFSKHTMATNNSSEFKKICGKDIEQLHKETDPAKKLPLIRRINAQMYAQSVKENYDDYTICQMLSDNLDDYMEHSVPVHEAKFNEMMKKLNINLTPAIVQPSFDVIDILKSKKCEGPCKNDVLLDEFDQFFNSMKKKPISSLGKINSPFTLAKPSNSEKIGDTNGEFVFKLNFRRKTDASQSTQNINQSVPKPAFNYRSNQAPENRFASDQHHSTSTPSTSTDYNMSTTRNTFHPFGGLKRKPEETAGNFVKKSTWPPKPEPEPIEPNPFQPKCDFKSAHDELIDQYNKKHSTNNQNKGHSYNAHPDGGLRRSLGGRRTIHNKFTPPFANQDNNSSAQSGPSLENNIHGIDMTHPRLKNVEAKMIETISNEIMDQCDRVEWSSIAGLEYAKKVIMEAVVLPILRPDIFTGLRQPPRGVLLFGPPGTGKTLIGKCIASQSESTFFSISASSLTSKWIGEGEKMVRALFAVAAAVQPSVVFIDEVDSLLCQRSESEHESSRRLKTEFLVQLDGAGTTEKDRILIVGATNRPQELDEAARRRFVKRLYVPLPETSARREIMMNLLASINHVITEAHLEEIAQRTKGFSGADMKVLCQEAVMGPVRSISINDMRSVAADSVRPVNFTDFLNALKCVRASVSPDDLQQYVDWNNTYGSGGDGH